MKVAPSEMSIFFDVDDTLIMWDDKCHIGGDEYTSLTCPHDGRITFHKVHYRHIEFLKKQKAKGYTVVVWSASGTKWAEMVVKELNLETYVDFVTSKPLKWVDDMPNPKHLVGSHIYLDINGHSL